MAGSEKLRIRIKGYEHATVDAAAAKIVETAKRGGAQNPWGAQEFLTYGIPIVEIKAKATEHDQVTHYAFRRGLFSWMIGERELDPEWYTETWRSF